MSIVKEIVCADCESLEIIYRDCRCVWDKKYPTIELEFAKCDHCGHTDTQPIDSEFNDKQREEFSKKNV